MNRIAHSFWSAVTIGTFVAGSQWARSPSSEVSKTDPPAPPSPILQTTAAPSAIAASRGAASEFLARTNPALARLLTSTEGRPLTSAEIATLVEAATKSGSAIERRQAFDRILAEVGSAGFTPEQAVAIRGMMIRRGASREMWRLFDYAWGANKPLDAIAHLEDVPLRYRDGFHGNVVAGMASADAQAAMDYVDGLEGVSRKYFVGRLIEGLADRDPALATEYVMGLVESGDPGARDYMRQLAREVLGTSGLEASVAWAQRLPDGPLLGHALMPIANEFAKRDPTAAAEWAESFTGTPGSERVVGEVVREWGDWRQASAWVDSLPAGQARLDGISAVWGFRGSQEPQRAVQDIIGMPPSREKDYAINGFISGLAHIDGEAATLWAAEITEPHMRSSAVLRAGSHFARQHPEEAAAWFADAPGLPADAWSRVGGR